LELPRIRVITGKAINIAQSVGVWAEASVERIFESTKFKQVQKPLALSIVRKFDSGKILVCGRRSRMQTRTNGNSARSPSPEMGLKTNMEIDAISEILPDIN